MARVHLRPLAREDIVNLWLGVAQRADPLTATRLVRGVERQLDTLATFPAMGRERPELPYPKLRTWPIGELVAFYVPLEDGIDVLRIIAAKQDIDRIAREGGLDGQGDEPRA